MFCKQVWSDGIFPNLIFKDPEPEESDQRGTFCLSISPPDPEKITVTNQAIFSIRLWSCVAVIESILVSGVVFHAGVSKGCSVLTGQEWKHVRRAHGRCVAGALLWTGVSQSGRLFQYHRFWPWTRLVLTSNGALHPSSHRASSWMGDSQMHCPRRHGYSQPSPTSTLSFSILPSTFLECTLEIAKEKRY